MINLHSLLLTPNQFAAESVLLSLSLLSLTPPLSPLVRSSWVMINLRTRRLAKVPEAFREKCMGFVDEGRHAIPPAATKHKLPDLVLPAEVGLARHQVL